MMIKEFFVSLLHYFVDITTAVLIAAAIFMTLSGKQVTGTILWQILLCGFITALPTAFFLCLDTKSVRLSRVLWCAHALMMYFMTLLLLNVFGWCRITPLSAALTLLATGFIYTFTGSVHYLVDRKHTTLMNEKLKKRYAPNAQIQKTEHQ